MPLWVVSLISNIIPSLVSLVIKHYERREDELDAEARAKLDAHRIALNVLKPKTKENLWKH